MELFLEQKQIQKLSPQMIQSMEILQMGALELQKYVEELLLENPVLEREEFYQKEEGSNLIQRLEWLSSNRRQGHHPYPQASLDLSNWAVDSGEESLYDHLSSQVPWKYLSPVMRRGVECVLTGLNDNGWLEETTEELAQRGGVSPDVIDDAEVIVQNLEPAGVGARTLAQCLKIQLLRRGENGLALTIVKNHLEDMAKNHYNQIAKATGASREEIQQSCRLIRSLDPKPGAAFAPRELPSYITPDLFVTEEDGRLVVTFTEQSPVELKMSAYYQNLVNSSAEPQVIEYLTDKLRQADWVIKGIEQRKDTVLRCVRCIVAWQEDFFRRGKHFLHPMTLADIAAEAGIHESTVSRALKNKFLQCTWGIFPISYLFGRALSSGETECSAEQVKSFIRALVEKEDKRKPLSDQKLCEALAQQKIFIARRTVAKYRDELGLPSAPGRKEF